MVRTLADSIVELQQLGYSAEQTQSVLAQQGYSPEQIRQALPQHHARTKSVIISLALVTITAVVLALVFWPSQQVQPALRVKVELLSSQAEPLSEVTASVELASQKPKPSTLTYELANAQTRQVVLSQEDLTPAALTYKKQVRLQVPDLADGTYVLTVTAVQEGKQVSSLANLNVKRKQTTTTTNSSIITTPLANTTQPLVSTNQSSSENSTTDQNRTPQNPASDDLASVLNKYDWSQHFFRAIAKFTEKNTLTLKFLDVNQAFKLSINPAGTVIRAEPTSTPTAFVLNANKKWIEYLDLQHPEQTARWCTSIQKSEAKDACFGELAQVTLQSGFCDSILVERTGDDCFAVFALRGDYSVCQKFTSQNLRASCKALEAAGT